MVKTNKNTIYIENFRDSDQDYMKHFYSKPYRT